MWARGRRSFKKTAHQAAAQIVQLHQQPAEHLAATPPGLPAGKAPGHPPQQIGQQRGPGIIGYRGSSDCRVLIVSHKPIMIAPAASLRSYPPNLQEQPTSRTTAAVSAVHANIQWIAAGVLRWLPLLKRLLRRYRPGHAATATVRMR